MEPLRRMSRADRVCDSILGRAAAAAESLRRELVPAKFPRGGGMNADAKILLLETCPVPGGLRGLRSNEAGAEITLLLPRVVALKARGT